ncbi:MAG: chalcone isomerase family protein [Burkholderiaceae bacterium]|nr:chalcone isomerase family protein [Burkholderiaceae bacterium]
MKQTPPAGARYHCLRVVVLWLFAACVMTNNSYAADTAPAHIQKELAPAYLSGLGSFRWFGLKIYDAQLWVGKQGYNSATPESSKFALDLRYARALQGRKIAEASRDEMQKLGLGNAQQLAEWQSKMEQIFPDVSEGTHLTGVYLPNSGARFYLDGKAIGEIMDAAFAQAFFAIWLAPKTTAPQLRTALLADAAAR